VAAPASSQGLLLAAAGEAGDVGGAVIAGDRVEPGDDRGEGGGAAGTPTPSQAPDQPERNGEADLPAAAAEELGEFDDGSAQGTPDFEEDESVLLNFERGDIREVIHSLATALGLSYMIDPKVEGQVTIRTIGRISKEDLFPVFNRILRNNGIAAVQVGEVYHIIPIEEAKTRAILPPSAASRSQLESQDSFVIEILPVLHVGSQDMATVIEPFISPGGDVFAYPRGNLLIVTDLTTNVERLRYLVKTLDTDAFRDVRTRVFKIKNGDIDIVSEELATLLGSYGHAVDGSTGLSMIPIPRLESLTVISFDPNVFAEIERWLRVLDIPPEDGAGRRVHVYRVENAKAADLSAILNELFGGGTPGSGGFGTGGTRPGSAFGQTRSAFGRPAGPAGGQAAAGGLGAVGGRQAAGRGATAAPQVTADGPVTAQQLGGGLGGGGTGVGGRRGAQGREGLGREAGGQFGGGRTGLGRRGAVGAATGVGAGAVGVILPGGREASGRFGGLPGPPPIFKEEVRIVADEVTNSLVILAVKQDYEKIVDVLKEVDVVPRQVVIEVVIAEVTLNKGLEFGVDHALRYGKVFGNENLRNSVWSVRNFGVGPGSDDGDGGDDTTDGTGDDTTDGTGIAGIGRALGGGILGLASPGAGGFSALITDSENFIVLLRALAAKSAVKILSAPHIIAADNREAHIQVGSSIPILTGTSTSVLTATSTVVNQVQYRDVGTILTILPQVNSAGLVNMQVTQEISAVGDESFGLTNSPSFLTREAETTVVAQNGDSILIGGIIDDQRTSSRDGVPFLMDVPVLGRFFRIERAGVQRTELLILITPHVIRNRGEALAVTEEFKQVVHGFEQLLRDVRTPVMQRPKDSMIDEAESLGIDEP
jgi:general secretion pathway protein D